MPSPLDFTLSGYIRETESGLGVAGLLVRAYDKDLFFDDLLGNATTDADGRFALHYSETDFNELLDRRPDLYLSVYAPPQRLLLSTENAVRWNAGTHEAFELRIDREKLGPFSPIQPADRVVISLELDHDALTIEQRDGFDVPRLPGFHAGGVPGEPALPHQISQVALPRGGNVLRIQVTPGDPIRLDGPFDAMPVQQPVPDRGLDPRTGHPLPTFAPFTPPNLRLYEAAADSQEMVRIRQTRSMGPVQLISLDVCPVRYQAASGSYLFFPDLRYEVVYDREAADRTAAAFWQNSKPMGEWFAEQLENMLKNPNIVWGQGIFWYGPPQLEDVPHLIITDNFSWPASKVTANGLTRPPTADEPGAPLPGDLLTEFKRLADWRTQHGMRSRVVSITDILKGAYGDFTQNGFALDLQEVIRNFIRFAHKTWGTLYVVLGGDITVVPMRFLAGALTGEDVCTSPVTTNPPDKRQSYHVTGTSVTKLHADFDPKPDQPLCQFNNGTIWLYNEQADAGQPGWYYTTEDDFNQKNGDFTRQPAASATRYIILETPAGAVNNAIFYWVNDSNNIPTDFYYASLVNDTRYNVPSKHDFDPAGNGLYGQYTNMGAGDTSLDGVTMDVDVWVGRIPALSRDDVRAYINKLITYEDLKVPGAPQQTVDPQYTRKMLFAADFWDSHWMNRQTDSLELPDEGRFTYKEFDLVIRLHLDFDLYPAGSAFDWTLYRSKGAVRTAIPHGISGQLPFWVFTTDDSYSEESDVPTRFVLFYGTTEQKDVDHFVWYTSALDRAMDQKEDTRALIAQTYPQFKQVNRFYTDADNLPVSVPPSLDNLTVTALRQALNQGPHFVSLTGHGWWGGCCTLDATSDPNFANNRQYFIVFADSCSTARPDAVEAFEQKLTSMGEKMVLNPDGGAVAYVGNTRYSWTGLGFGYEQFFWQELASSVRVGIAAGWRLTTAWNSMWTDYAQILYGDPALKVWTNVPGTLPKYKYKIDRDYLILSVVHPGDPVMARVRPGDPVESARVTLTTEDGLFLTSGKTNAFGQLRLPLEGYDEQSGPLRLTILTSQMSLLRDTIQIRQGKP